MKRIRLRRTPQRTVYEIGLEDGIEMGLEQAKHTVDTLRGYKDKCIELSKMVRHLKREVIHARDHASALQLVMHTMNMRHKADEPRDIVAQKTRNGISPDIVNIDMASLELREASRVLTSITTRSSCKRKVRGNKGKSKQKGPKTGRW